MAISGTIGNHIEFLTPMSGYIFTINFPLNHPNHKRSTYNILEICKIAALAEAKYILSCNPLTLLCKAHS